MPVEIRELVIKTTIDNSTSKKGGGKGDQKEESQKMIVQECVEQVMDLLKMQKER